MVLTNLQSSNYLANNNFNDLLTFKI
jgi:hypothetical protein